MTKSMFGRASATVRPSARSADVARRRSPVRWSRTWRQSDPGPKYAVLPASRMADAPERSWRVTSFGAVARAADTRRAGILTRAPSTSAPAARKRSSASGTGNSTPVRSRIARAASSSRAAVGTSSRSQRGVSRASVMRAPSSRPAGGCTAPPCEGGGRARPADRDLRPDSGPFASEPPARQPPLRTGNARRSGLRAQLRATDAGLGQRAAHAGPATPGGPGRRAAPPAPGANRSNRSNICIGRSIRGLRPCRPMEGSTARNVRGG